jgi:two-component system, NtrC family, nitrogen regulation response regulator NtrX
MAETILIVDDEDSVRRTFRDWLTGSGFDVEVFAAGDAESALVFANQRPIDLAILDWNLGSGSDGLRLLEDLVEFRPDVVAILVTGFAHQATPLEALRMGVRDYIDKNQDLNRDSFLAAVRKQLARIVPEKRQRDFNRGLARFRESVEKILPLVQSTRAMNEPVSLPEVVKGLFRFLIHATGATDGVLLARHLEANGNELLSAFRPDGQPQVLAPIPFSRSLFATVLSLSEPSVLTAEDLRSLGPVELFDFEATRQSILTAPIRIGEATSVAIELFDKPGGFSQYDRRFFASALPFTTDLLRLVSGEREVKRLLFDAVEAALKASELASEQVSQTLETGSASPPPDAVLEQLKMGLGRSDSVVVDAESSLALAEGVRELALRHGPAAVRYVVQQVHELRRLLDEAAGISNG